MTAASIGRIVSRHSKRRDVGIGSSSQVWGSDSVKISRTVVSEAGVKDKSGLPLKGLPRECAAQGCESRSDRMLLILLRASKSE